MSKKLVVALCISILAITAISGAVLARPADAGVRTTACGEQLFEQPFLHWLDPSNYVLAPDGAMEGGASGWTLSGGARVVAGSESFGVHGRADGLALSLPSGSSALTPELCIGVDAPVARFFVLDSGSLLSTLKVEVVSRNLLGLRTTTRVALLTGTPVWQPTLPLAFLTNVTSLEVLANQTTRVSFRFTPLGASSGWKIDDLYVDPFKGS